MKKILFFIQIFSFSTMILAQTTSCGFCGFREAYVDVQVTTQAQLQQLADRFSIDKVSRDAEGFNVRLWLGQKDYSDFLQTGLAYNLVLPSRRGELTMANTYAEMANWNKYPTYSVYCAMMDSFQTKFPYLCKVDTLLSFTPNGHKILACHIGTNLDGSQCRPQFFYNSTIHGDEQTGFVIMLHLIDYLLNNYTTDAQVQRILNTVDLWICPAQNPDGMYAISDDIMGGWGWGHDSYSTRANANGVDLNRCYPIIGQVAKDSYEPEIQAIMDFFESLHFVASACFHGGAEVFNYPWDTWTTEEVSHTDILWWNYVGRNFADTCHRYGGSSYFTDEDNGVTSGGDWYVVSGGHQDYLNYYQYCRDVTIEISAEKSPNASMLPQYWNSLKHSLLDYVEECGFGFRGTVTDSLTGEPLEAEVFIANHDLNNSEVYSYLPYGQYYRPIKSGTYSVTYSVEGYYPKTISVSVADGMAQIEDVQLVRNQASIKSLKQENCVLYPNPASSQVIIKVEKDLLASRGYVYDVTGKMVMDFTADSDETCINVSRLHNGTYFVQIGKSLLILTVQR